MKKDSCEGHPRCDRLIPTLFIGVATALLAICPPTEGSTRQIFSDQTDASGLDFEHFNGMSGELYFPEVFGPGTALFDYDGDGDLDAYLVQGNMLGDDKSASDALIPPPAILPLSDRLLRNDLVVGSDGFSKSRFVDVTTAAEINETGYGMGVASGDFNNDGSVDLYVTNFGSNVLLRNNGDGTLSDVTGSSGTDDRRWSVSASFLDFDRDGWLDIYVGNYVEFRIAIHKRCSSSSGAADYCAPIVYKPESDRLFRNRGDGTFEDVTQSSGIDQEFGGALGVVGADFNADDWIDIYVANDGTPNQLWINQGDGTFSNDAVLGGTAVNELGMPEASMGVVAGDFDGNGTTDLFVTHLAEETNTFYRNDGLALFREVTRDSGLGLPSWQYTGFGASLSDFDNDSWLDLMVVNGAVKRIGSQVRMGHNHPLKQTNQLFRNLGHGKFEDVTPIAGEALEVEEVSRGLASGDVDNDGDTDFLITNNAGPGRLLVNEIGQDAPWLGVRMVDPSLNRDAHGAQFSVTRQAQEPNRRRIATDGSYASANDPRVTVGRGDSSDSVDIEAVWPSGEKQKWLRLPSERYFTFVRGQ